jgi:hypothetical protein
MARRSTDSGLSDRDRNVLLRLEKHGWFVNKVMSDDTMPQFAYSFGLYERWKHPELILFGMPLDAMHTVINNAAKEISGGGSYADGGKTNDLFNEYPCAFRRVEPAWYPMTFKWTSWYYTSVDFPALQLVWPESQRALSMGVRV